MATGAPGLTGVAWGAPLHVYRPAFSNPRRAMASHTPAFTAAASAIAASTVSRGIPASSARWIRLCVQGSHVFVSVAAGPMKARSRSVSSGAALALASAAERQLVLRDGRLAIEALGG